MANIVDDDEDDNKSVEVSLMTIKRNNLHISVQEVEEKDNFPLRSEKVIEFTYRLSQQDMIVLNNIVKLSLVIIISSIAVILLGIIISFTRVLSQQQVKYLLK